MKKLVMLVLSFVLVLSLVSCGGNDEYPKISSRKVEKISLLGTDGIIKDFSSDEVKTFIKLYNESEFVGNHTEDIGGTTPDYGALIYFEDGSYFQIWECIAVGREFEVNAFNSNGEQEACFYLNNQEMKDFFVGMDGIIDT